MRHNRSHRSAGRTRALFRRVLRAQLRLKVMAGVVAVTLVALPVRRPRYVTSK